MTEPRIRRITLNNSSTTPKRAIKKSIALSRLNIVRIYTNIIAKLNIIHELFCKRFIL